MILTHKDILGTESLSREEIEGILDTAVSFKEVSTRQIKKVPTCVAAPSSICFSRPARGFPCFFQGFRERCG